MWETLSKSRNARLLEPSLEDLQTGVRHEAQREREGLKWCWGTVQQAVVEKSVAQQTHADCEGWVQPWARLRTLAVPFQLPVHRDERGQD